MAVDELKKYEEELKGHVQMLEEFSGLSKGKKLHFLPEVCSTEAGSVCVVSVHNPEGGNTQMNGIPAAFFYEAYREKLPEIFALAVKRAKGSAKSRAEELKKELLEKKKALEEEEKELLAFFDEKPKRGKK